MLIRDAMTEKKEQPKSASMGGYSEENEEIINSEEATGQEQQQYERMVLAGVQTVADENMSKGLVGIMKQIEQPEEGLAEATALVVGEIDSRGDFPETVILPAAGEILQNVAELAKSAKIYELDQSTVQGAADVLSLKLAEMYGIDPQDPEFQDMLQKTDQTTVQSMVGKYGRATA